VVSRLYVSERKITSVLDKTLAVVKRHKTTYRFY